MQNQEMQKIDYALNSFVERTWKKIYLLSLMIG